MIKNRRIEMQMNRVSLVLLGIFFVTCLMMKPAPAEAYSLNLVGSLQFSADSSGCGMTSITGGSDCWGYTAPDSTEYAIMGALDGVAFVKVDTTLELIDFVPGPVGADCYYHRDFKTYQNYAYAVAEMRGTNEGLMIIDLQFLPDSVHFVKSVVNGSDIRSHNLSIDTTNGFAYVLKQDYTGFRVIDLADPENPVELPHVVTPEIHDVFARNDTVFVSEGRVGSFSYYDMSNKLSPQLIKRVPIPLGGYSHNIWASDIGPYVMTTEETVGKTVKVWDISDTSNIVMVGEYLGPNDLAHNTHIQGRFAYLSHYSYGVVVVDLMDPSNPVEVARYDTYVRDDSPGFWGCWGAFPFTRNGYIYVSDIEGDLTVLAFDSLATGTEENSTFRNPHSELSLLQNYPNPFYSSTTIRYSLSRPGQVQLSVYNLLGQEVKRLVDGFQPADSYETIWDGKDSEGLSLTSGIYFYRIVSEGSGMTKRLTLIKNGR
jgi:choice-of-anchor B domain-containing protein